MQIKITTPTHRQMLSQIRGLTTRPAQVHRNRHHEAKAGYRKHKGAWD